MMLTIFRPLTLLIVCAAISGCDKSESYRLVSEKYNFSVEFPEKPTEQMKVNDEGLLKGYWQVSRDKVLAKEYYAAEATSYKEILNPDDELVPNDVEATSVNVAESTCSFVVSVIDDRPNWINVCCVLPSEVAV